MDPIVVLHTTAHGIPAEECSDQLRERLPDADVRQASSRREERELVRDAAVVVGRDLRPELLEAAENLQLFACSSAGVGHLDLETLRDREIAVTNASGVHGPNIAEHVIGWILMITRRLDEGMRRQERREWRHFQATSDLHDSRVCVVGLGAIGQAILERLEGFGVETVGVRYSPEKGGPVDEVYGFEEIEQALVGVDYLVLACPLTDETRGLIGAAELETLPPNAVLVNVGRGPLIDTDELLSALRNEGLHAAALDVTDPEPLPEDHPLWGLGNVYITPHNSGYTPAYWDRVADILVQNLEQIDEDGPDADLKNQVA